MWILNITALVLVTPPSLRRSRHLGKVVVGTTEANCDWTTLSEKHIDILSSWEAKYRSKYSIVGWVVPDEGYYERARSFDP